MPGIYEECIYRNDYNWHIDLVGSGEDVTRIIGPETGCSLAVIDFAGGVNLKKMTIESNNVYAIRFVANGSLDHVKCISPNVAISQADVGHVSILSSYIESTNNVGITVGIWSPLNTMKIVNSTINGLDKGIYFSGSGQIEIYNSSVSGVNAIDVSQLDPGKMIISGSQIKGSHNLVSGRDKIINCYDTDFNPIPNQ